MIGIYPTWGNWAFTVGDDEELVIDSEDLTSCFNLFRLPKVWSGYMAFAKTVSGAVFGVGPGLRCYVGMQVVPIGWINAVAVTQTTVRRLVFGLSGVLEDSEVSKVKPFPQGDSISVVYLDSFDEVRKVQKGLSEVISGKASSRHDAFVATCNRLRLPLNQGKRLLEQ